MLIEYPALLCQQRVTSSKDIKLLVNFGTIEGFFTASSIRPFPGKAEIDHEDQLITLRQASRLRSTNKSRVGICKCKIGCKTMKCVCKRSGLSCESGCHKCLKCNNDHSNKSNCSLIVPTWGEYVRFNNKKYIFANTCPIENWLFFFKLYSM